MPTSMEFLCATSSGGRCSITFAKSGTNTVTTTSDHRCVFLGWDHPFSACEYRPGSVRLSSAATVTSPRPQRYVNDQACLYAFFSSFFSLAFSPFPPSFVVVVVVYHIFLVSSCISVGWLHRFFSSTRRRGKKSRSIICNKTSEEISSLPLKEDLTNSKGPKKKHQQSPSQA